MLETDDANTSTKGTAVSSCDIVEWLRSGMSWDEYLSNCSGNIRRMKSIYDRLRVPEEFVSSFKSKGALTVVCIAEDWCPDCVQNVPLVVRLCESSPGMNLYLFFRDRSQDLMTRYLSNGKKIIPTVVFFDLNLNELGKWAGPSRKAKEWTIATLIKGRKIDEIPKDEMEAFDLVYDQKFLTQFYVNSLEELKAAVGLTHDRSRFQPSPCS